jgi:hypothetical protein
MNSIRDIIRSRKDRDSRLQPKISTLRCVTVGVDYPNDCAVKNRPGYVWVREQKADGAVFQVFNTLVKRLVGLPVIISSEGTSVYRKTISGIDWVEIPTTTGSPLQNSPTVYNHALSHEWQDTYPAADAISIYSRALVPLRVYPAKISGISIDIAKGFYGVGGEIVYFEGTDNYNLLPYQPINVNEYVGILVYLDVDTNSVMVIAGEISKTVADIVYPTIPASILPLAYVNISSAAVSIGESDIVTDIRPMFTVLDRTLQNSLGALAAEIDFQLSRHIVEGV